MHVNLLHRSLEYLILIGQLQHYAVNFFSNHLGYKLYICPYA